MTLYNNYLETPPSQLGTQVQYRRARLEWRYIQQQSGSIQSVLEIGPGVGQFAQLVRAARIPHYTGLEGNWQIADRLQTQGFQIVRGYAPPIPAADEQYDLVYASHVLEHMPTPVQALEFVCEARRVLRPGGLVALTCPDIMGFGDTFWHADYTHTFPVSSRRMRQLLSDAGLRILELRSIAGIVTGSAEPLVAWAARVLPLSLPGLSAVSRTRFERLKLTFMRNIFVIAQRPEKLC